MRLGKWGRMLDVPAPRRPFPLSSSRPSEVVTALSGKRYVTSAPVRRRTWRWDVSGLDDAALGALELLEQQAATGPVYWIDPTARGTNLLPPEVAAPVAGHGDVADAAEVLVVDGLAHDAVVGFVERDVPTVQGEAYTVRIAAGAHGDVLDLAGIFVEALDADGAVTGTVASATQADANVAEALSASWTAGAEPGVRVTLSGGSWAAGQMVVSALDPGVWRAGRGAPIVTVEGLDAVLAWAEEGGDIRWSSAAVTLVEVDV